MQEVVRLDHRVIQLEEAEAALLKTIPVGAVLHQLVDREVPSHVPQELDVLARPQPIGVVDEQRFAVAEVEIASELRANASQVALDHLEWKHRTLGVTVARVADHARATTNNGDRSMPRALEVRQEHDAHQVARMQAGGGRIESLVQGDVTGVQGSSQPGLVGDLRNEAALFERVDNVGGGHRVGHTCFLFYEAMLIRSRSSSANSDLGMSA